MNEILKHILSTQILISLYEVKNNLTEIDQLFSKNNCLWYFRIVWNYAILEISFIIFCYYLVKYINYRLNKIKRIYVNILVYNHLGQLLISKRLYEPNKYSYLVPGGKKEKYDSSLKQVAIRELYEETNLIVNNRLKYEFFYNSKNYEVHYYSLYLKDEQNLMTKEPEKHEEWFFTNEFYKYKLPPSMEFYKKQIINIIKPKYIVISGSTGTGKTSIIKKLKRKIEEKGFNVKIPDESSILDNYSHIKNYLKEYKQTKNNDKLKIFEYSLLNIYNKRREELFSSNKDFIIVDREIFDGDIYKLCYGWDEEIIIKEQVKFNIPMINFFISCDEIKIKENYFKRKVEEHKFSLEEYINFSEAYNNNYLNLANPKAIKIENNSNIDNSVNEIFDYIKPFLIKM